MSITDTKIKTLALTLLFLIFLSCKNTTEKKPEQVQTAVDSVGLNTKKIGNQKQFYITNGIWIDINDSLSSVQIKGEKWIFNYENEKTELDDYYNYQLTETVFDKENVIIGGTLTLSNPTDTLKYAIDYITNKNMTLIYFPRGNFHYYVKKG